LRSLPFFPPAMKAHLTGGRTPGQICHYHLASLQLCSPPFSPGSSFSPAQPVAVPAPSARPLLVDNPSLFSGQSQSMCTPRIWAAGFFLPASPLHNVLLDRGLRPFFARPRIFPLAAFLTQFEDWVLRPLPPRYLHTAVPYLRGSFVSVERP